MHSFERVAQNIRDIKVQGAKQIAIYALEYLKSFAKKNGFGLKFEVAANILENARPTAVVLHNCLEIVRKEKTLSSINELIRYLESTSKKIATYEGKIIKDNDKIMTHCHSGEAMSLIKAAWEKGKKLSLIATMTDPIHQGVMTAKELAKEKIPVILIEDSAVDSFMKDVNMVIVGADAIRKEGVVNKIGTSLIAKSAYLNRKPFYVVANMLKLDKRRKFRIEQRPTGEVYHNLKGVKIKNPAFDITQWRFITAVVTDKGVKTPNEILGMLK